jgi:hypothetical protein
MSKPIVWLAGEIKSPPVSRRARIEAGYLLRLLQEGVRLKMPKSRPMPSIGYDAMSFVWLTGTGHGALSTALTGMRF